MADPTTMTHPLFGPLSLDSPEYTSPLDSPNLSTSGSSSDGDYSDFFTLAVSERRPPGMLRDRTAMQLPPCLFGDSDEEIDQNSSNRSPLVEKRPMEFIRPGRGNVRRRLGREIEVKKPGRFDAYFNVQNPKEKRIVARELPQGHTHQTKKPNTYTVTETLPNGCGESKLVWNYNGVEYPFDQSWSGKYHIVRSFANGGPLTIYKSDGTTEVVDLSKVVLKYLNPQSVIAREIDHQQNSSRPKAEFVADENGLLQMDRDDLAGYEALQRVGMPCVKWYGPAIDPNDPLHGRFWVVEKLHSEVSHLLQPIRTAASIDDVPPESRRLLEFAKEWMRKIAVYAATTRKELINDFCPRNIMIRHLFNAEGTKVGEEFVMCDFSKPLENFRIADMCKHLKQWAGYDDAHDPNPAIYNWLIDVGPLDAAGTTLQTLLAQDADYLDD